ncbi:LINE-1 retrotransposable element ORF2 protein [Cucumis melo var. makuwa]|uniref:LINE-1 retrotransposable element ORF2 protein n=1 Tax=Cucumis melo var. makuwa TaxID=1194695 RepID=A0A5A7USD6_CUCMM|nr:LINE-1 retrotransposable element ORF2 protein [Cucumis melo var. makuwa]
MSLLTNGRGRKIEASLSGQGDQFGGLVSRANLGRKIKGFKVGQDTFSISQQQFADDIVLYIFNEESIKNLFDTIKIFETCSRLSINLHKSEILAIDLEQSEVQKVADSYGCTVGLWRNSPRPSSK